MTIHTIEVVCTGSELLLGDTLNTNLAWLGQELAASGTQLVRETCVPDERSAMADALRTALSRSDAVIVIGGLGPTRDDLTRSVAAEILGRELAASEEVAAGIRRFLQGRGLNVPEAAIAAQSEVLVGSEVLANGNGTAPGFWCVADAAILVLLPGPPHEFRAMVRGEVLPRLRPLLVPQFARAEIRVAGIPESQVAAIVEGSMLAGVVPAYCAKPECISVRLEARANDGPLLARVTQRVRRALAPYALPADAATLAAAVGQLLRAQGLTLATAESCTGGGVAAILTDVPGCSDYFEGAVVSYSNRWKRDFLDVPGEILDRFGAVSEETIRSMLDGLATRYGAGCGIAVSGIAGPGGGTPDKPVGLVLIGTAVGAARQVRALHFRGDRDEVRRRTVFAALSQLRMNLLPQTVHSSAANHQ
ncbi:MAG: CinA family nicotinamide mononucleotide deamidase-related protein [Victivallales bacterium]|nr:CinA family nicotinamide mononucleotide deamidase-related protein [Victivallales bacterium]